MVFMGRGLPSRWNGPNAAPGWHPGSRLPLESDSGSPRPRPYDQHAKRCRTGGGGNRPQRQRCGTRKSRTGILRGCRRPVRPSAAPLICRRFTPNSRRSQGIDSISRGSVRALLRLPWPARLCRAAQSSLAERRSHPSRVSWTGCSPTTGVPVIRSLGLRPRVRSAA